MNARRLLVLAIAGVLSGCGEGGPSGTGQAPPPPEPGGAAPDGNGDPAAPPCTVRIAAVPAEDALARLQAAVRAARPSDVICAEPGAYGSGRLVVDRSGRAGRPLQVRGLAGAAVTGIDVVADHVVVGGFAVGGGTSGEPGILVRGRGVEIVENTVRRPGGDGIECDDEPPFCTGVTIARNVVVGADGVGIVLYGRDGLVESNDVSGSVALTAGDADGMRFFGRGHVIRGNVIHGITDRGYPEGEEPHADCFQTFDDSRPPTRDVVIEQNVCLDVATQCLIATATEAGEDGAVGRSRGIVFRNNVCGTRGSQAILLRFFPDVAVEHNLFLEGVLYRAVFAQEGSTRVRVTGNVVLGQYAAYEVEANSQSGFRADYNLQFARGLGDPPDQWREPHGLWNVDPQLGVRAGDAIRVEAGVRERFVPPPGSPLVDAGAPGQRRGRDLLGQPGRVDGDGDGVPRPDIGPVELAAS